MMRIQCEPYIRYHYGGDGLCDSVTVQQFCTAAPQFLADLIDIGVPFDKTTQGAYKLTKEGAHAPKNFMLKIIPAMPLFKHYTRS